MREELIVYVSKRNLWSYGKKKQLLHYTVSWQLRDKETKQPMERINFPLPNNGNWYATAWHVGSKMLWEQLFPKHFISTIIIENLFYKKKKNYKMWHEQALFCKNNRNKWVWVKESIIFYDWKNSGFIILYTLMVLFWQILTFFFVLRNGKLPCIYSQTHENIHTTTKNHTYS